MTDAELRALSRLAKRMARRWEKGLHYRDDYGLEGDDATRKVMAGHWHMIKNGALNLLVARKMWPRVEPNP